MEALSHMLFVVWSVLKSGQSMGAYTWMSRVEEKEANPFMSVASCFLFLLSERDGARHTQTQHRVDQPMLGSRLRAACGYLPSKRSM